MFKLSPRLEKWARLTAAFAAAAVAVASVAGVYRYTQNHIADGEREALTAWFLTNAENRCDNAQLSHRAYNLRADLRDSLADVMERFTVTGEETSDGYRSPLQKLAAGNLAICYSDRVPGGYSSYYDADRNIVVLSSSASPAVQKADVEIYLRTLSQAEKLFQQPLALGMPEAYGEGVLLRRVPEKAAAAAFPAAPLKKQAAPGKK